MSKIKKLLILGGNTLSCEIVKKAKEMGIYTVVTDWYDVKKSPAKLLADKYYNISIADYNEILKIIELEKIDGIYTGFTDSSLIHYVNIARLANLPHYINENQIENTTNKFNFKKMCRECGIPVVEEYNLNNLDDIENLNIEYPVLLKPVDNSGGRGIFKCYNKQELEIYYYESLRYSDSKKVLIEKYIESPEVHFVYVIKNGEVKLATMGDRYTKYVNNDKIIPLPIFYSYPSRYLNLYFEILHSKMLKLFKKLEIDNGFVLIQSFIKNNNFILYEIGYRLVGSLENKIIEYQSGFDPLAMMIDYSLNNSLEKYELIKISPFSSNKYFSLAILIREGQISRITGLDTIKNNNNILDIVILRPEGDIISSNQIGTLAQVAIRIFGTYNNINELYNIVNFVYLYLQICDSYNENMIISSFNLKDLVC